MAPAEVPSSIVRFGVFEADLRAGQLRKNGAKVRIQDLPFRALALLLSRPYQVVTRDELRQALWPDGVFVDFERGISTAIKRVRDTLGDSADSPVFIETVERHGYRWIGPILPPEHAPEEQAVRAEVIPRRRFSSWRKLLFALPVVALLFAVWMFRPSYRDAKAGAAKSVSSAGSRHHAANREAEDFYLKGRFYWNKRTPESLNQAVDAFTQAVVHDPTYADAYVGLADCYNLLREYTMMPASEAYPRALAAAKKAVELDDGSSEAHASLAFVSFYGMWDVGTADQEFRRAIDLDPNNARAHHWYATFLQAIGRNRESLAEIERARELDPNSSSVLADKGALLWDAGRHQEALQLLKQLEATEPDFVSPHRYLRFAYFETGDYSNYLAEMKKEAILTHDAPLLAVAEAAAKGFDAHGERGLLEGQMREQKKLLAQGSLSPYWLAQTENRLGRSQETLKHLEISAQTHDANFLLLEGDPVFANLHEAPAFKQLLAKVWIAPVN